MPFSPAFLSTSLPLFIFLQLLQLILSSLFRCVVDSYCAVLNKGLIKMGDQKLLSVQEISGHNNPEDCWIVVDNQVWDVTDFLEEHPGGSTSKE